MTPHEISKYVIGTVNKETQREKTDNIRAGMIVAAIYEVNRNPKKRKKPYTWRDIIKDEPTDKHVQSTDEMKNICKTMCKAMGGKINGT